MKTLLVGNFGAGNVGDELILAEAVELYGAQNIIAVTADAEASQRFCETTFETIPMPPTGIRSWLSFMQNSTLKKKWCALGQRINKVEFAGGGLFAITLKAYWIWFSVAYFLKKGIPHVPHTWVHQGVDTTTNPLKIWFLQNALRDAHFITVRDEASKNMLSQLNMKAKNVGDRVHTGVLLSKQKNNTESKRVLVNAKSKLRHPISGATYIAFAKEDLAFMPNNTIYPQTISEVKSLFQNTSIAIGERLHFIITAHKILGSAKTFTLKKPYSEKVERYCQKHKIEVWQGYGGTEQKALLK